MSVLIRGMDMPKRCYDCGLYKSLHMDSDGYGDNCDYCGALKRRFNQDKCDINPFKQKLSDCPLIEVADTPQTDKDKVVCPNCGRSDYIRSFEKDFNIKNSEYRYKCINCNTYIKDTPQTAQRIAEFQKLCGIKIDPDLMNIDCTWK